MARRPSLKARRAHVRPGGGSDEREIERRERYRGALAGRETPAVVGGDVLAVGAALLHVHAGGFAVVLHHAGKSAHADDLRARAEGEHTDGIDLFHGFSFQL